MKLIFYTYTLQFLTWSGRQQNNQKWGFQCKWVVCVIKIKLVNVNTFWKWIGPHHTGAKYLFTWNVCGHSFFHHCNYVVFTQASSLITWYNLGLITVTEVICKSIPRKRFHYKSNSFKNIKAKNAARRRISFKYRLPFKPWVNYRNLPLTNNSSNTSVRNQTSFKSKEYIQINHAAYLTAQTC